MPSLSDIVVDATQWIQGAGPIGPAAFAALYVVAAVLLVPGSVLTLAAGFAYGPVWGTLLVSPVSVAAAVAAFALARTALRPRIRRRLRDAPRFAAVDRAIGQRGARIVVLLRLSPLVPYGALNYLCGLTRMEPRAYAAASFVGMLPGTVLYTYIGSTIPRAVELARGPTGRPTGENVLYWAGLVATIAVAFVITRVARRAIREQLPRDSVT